MCGRCGSIVAFYWTSLGADTCMQNAVLPALFRGWAKSLVTSLVLDFAISVTVQLEMSTSPWPAKPAAVSCLGRGPE